MRAGGRVSERGHGFPGILLRGMLMGAADIVPGVSGGTMAFITGIYQRLLTAITAFDLVLARLVFGGRWAEAWRRADGAFLVALVGGIGVSVFSLARVITLLLDTQPLALWSFFFGLILASAAVLLRHVAAWSPPAVAGLAAGVVFAGFIGLSPAFDFPVGPVSFFVAGFIAICAMILPGVSGSFILVLLGMYPRVLAAIETFDLPLLLLFALGAACGLLAFSRLLRFVLERFHAITLATLTGFLIGSLPVVWPWKLNSPGEVPARPVGPPEYAAVFGTSDLVSCIVLIGVGFLAVWFLERRWGGLER